LLENVKNVLINLRSGKIDNFIEIDYEVIASREILIKICPDFSPLSLLSGD
jgi:hypothetical protein